MKPRGRKKPKVKARRRKKPAEWWCPRMVRMRYLGPNGETVFEVPSEEINPDATIRDLAAVAFDHGYELHFQIHEVDMAKNGPVK